MATFTALCEFGKVLIAMLEIINVSFLRIRETTGILFEKQ